MSTGQWALLAIALNCRGNAESREKAEGGETDLGNMGEEVSREAISFCIRGVRITDAELVKACRIFLSVWQTGRGHNRYARGKQTLKQLIGQNTETTNIEISDGNIKSFERVARKYGIDFALKKDKSCQPPKYYVFFKARDMEAMTGAFKEFVAKNEKKNARRTFKEVLKKFTEIAQSCSREVEKTKAKSRGQSL